MCGYTLQTEIRTEAGWRWFGRFGYAIRQDGSLAEALEKAQQAVRKMKAEHGGTWGTYRLVETNCSHDCWLLDLHSGEAKQTPEDSSVYPGSAFYPADQEREARNREFRESLRRCLRGGGTMSSRRMRRVTSEGSQG